MSFVFRGYRGDIESGYNLIPERRTVRFHGAGRPLNANPMVILLTMFLLFMILNFHQISPNFLLWFGMAVFLMGTSLRVYAMCQQIQGHANAAAVAAAAAAEGFLGHTEVRLRMPPISFSARGRLQGLRLQLAVLDRDFDDLDYDALRALDPDNPPGVPALSEADINALPIHKYRASAAASLDSSSTAASLGSSKKDEDGRSKQDEDLTCSVCLEQVMDGDVLRSLPCLHQFHPHCIDQWLKQQATCPVCKFKLTSSSLPPLQIP